MSWLLYVGVCFLVFVFFKQKTAYEMRISDWSSDVCSPDLDYIEVALERIEAALPLDESALTIMQSAKAQPKVAFGTLVETGYLQPGAVLTDSKRRWQAVVRADGSLSVGTDTGSIHKMGATLQGAPSCNGWTFWHCEVEGVLKPIDALRQTYLLANEP